MQREGFQNAPRREKIHTLSMEGFATHGVAAITRSRFRILCGRDLGMDKVGFRHGEAVGLGRRLNWRPNHLVRSGIGPSSANTRLFNTLNKDDF